MDGEGEIFTRKVGCEGGRDCSWPFGYCCHQARLKGKCRKGPAEAGPLPSWSVHGVQGLHLCRLMRTVVSCTVYWGVEGCSPGSRQEFNELLLMLTLVVHIQQL